MCATTACQVYDGATPETPATDQAAYLTRGLIVAYDGKPASTFFSADSGGFTASAREVWGGDLPYLKARPDPESPGARKPWTVTPDASMIASVLARFAPKAGTYRSLSVAARSESGRITALDVVGASGTTRVDGARAGELVRALGAPSTLASITSTNPLTLNGTGNGHGVGLSQWGARSMAEKGWSFDQILAYYYQGVTLANYEVTQ